MQRVNHERFFILTCSMVLAAVSVFSCRTFAAEAMPLIRLVDMHTAGVIPKGFFAVESRIYEGNNTGFLVSVAAGITDRFSLGLGYGAEGIIGRSRDPHFDPFPGCMVKYRLLDENFLLPGIAIGFDYQGFGGIASAAKVLQENTATAARTILHVSIKKRS